MYVVIQIYNIFFFQKKYYLSSHYSINSNKQQIQLEIMKNAACPFQG
jgi:hypothetical protein